MFDCQINVFYPTIDLYPLLGTQNSCDENEELGPKCEKVSMTPVKE